MKDHIVFELDVLVEMERNDEHYLTAALALNRLAEVFKVAWPAGTRTKPTIIVDLDRFPTKPV